MRKPNLGYGQQKKKMFIVKLHSKRQLEKGREQRKQINPRRARPSPPWIALRLLDVGATQPPRNSFLDPVIISLSLDIPNFIRIQLFRTGRPGSRGL